MITKFKGKYRFLSNFYPSAMCPPTLEHHFQAAKCLDSGDREYIMGMKTPGLAKRAGRHQPMVENWNEIKLQVMENLVRQKFTEPALRDALLATGIEILVEGNEWGDQFWGATPSRVSYVEPELMKIYEDRGTWWIGHNHLGKILMKIRSEIQREARIHPNSLGQIPSNIEGEKQC